MKRMFALGLLAATTAQVAPASAAGRRPAAPPPAPLEAPARTPLYCEDSTHTIRPVSYGDLGDLMAPHDRQHMGPGKLTPAAPNKAGEDSFRLTFAGPSALTYTLTRHDGGYALRAVSTKSGTATRAKRSSGNAMCFRVLETLLDADPARALAFRKTWTAGHPDSTGR